ncbi:MAG TPA: PQQ-binding-like beta-propeller repeat protein [Acidimicrobiales bacterium]|nr:PQQ-binding-like beta-propeller repeat protein [Acidimicrobiales bacterium]
MATVRKRSAWAAAALLAAAAATVVASARPARAATITLEQQWSVSIPDGSLPIAQSSPTVATLDNGGPAVLVGDRAGHIYALHLSNGSEVAGWPVSTPLESDGTTHVPINGAISSFGSTVYAGEGWRANASAGGLAAYDAAGRLLWFRPVPSAPGSTATVGVDGGAAVGDLQGQADVVSGSMAQYAEAVDASNGAVLSGWPWFEADSNFSTPAVADLYANGVNEVVMGGDSTAGSAMGQTYTNGGHVRVVSPTGSLDCVYNTNQGVQSSPAVGQFLPGGAVGIVSGTGYDQAYAGASDTDRVLALDTHCGLVWSTVLDGITTASPALVDALGDGGLQVAEATTYDNGSAGTVYLLNPSNGQVVWSAPAPGGVYGGVVSVDLGGGYQDLVVAGTSGAEILDGKTGAVLWSWAGGVSFQNAPLVTDDPNGTVGITFAGYTSSGSEVVHFEVPGSSGGVVDESGAWPMFHHDPQLTGDAGTPSQPPCPAPAGGPHGYWLAASDGGIFTFGNLSFCGSTGNLTLNKPIVGMASTPDGGGYWLVASDGGIFTFGDAHFYGSTGNLTLNKPVVGMSAG